MVGDVHTNSVEGVWSLLKRSIVGAWHQVSAKHLDAYLSEVEFRIKTTARIPANRLRLSGYCDTMESDIVRRQVRQIVQSWLNLDDSLP